MLLHPSHLIRQVVDGGRWTVDGCPCDRDVPGELAVLSVIQSFIASLSPAQGV